MQPKKRKWLIRERKISLSDFLTICFILEDNEVMFLRYLRKANTIREFYIQKNWLTCTKGTGNYYAHVRTQGRVFPGVLPEGFTR